MPKDSSNQETIRALVIMIWQLRSSRQRKRVQELLSGVIEDLLNRRSIDTRALHHANTQQDSQSDQSLEQLATQNDLYTQKKKIYLPVLASMTLDSINACTKLQKHNFISTFRTCHSWVVVTKREQTHKECALQLLPQDYKRIPQRADQAQFLKITRKRSHLTSQLEAVKTVGLSAKSPFWSVLAVQVNQSWTKCTWVQEHKDSSYSLTSNWTHRALELIIFLRHKLSRRKSKSIKFHKQRDSSASKAQIIRLSYLIKMPKMKSKY